MRVLFEFLRRAILPRLVNMAAALVATTADDPAGLVVVLCVGWVLAWGLTVLLLPVVQGGKQENDNGGAFITLAMGMGILIACCGLLLPAVNWPWLSLTMVLCDLVFLGLLLGSTGVYGRFKDIYPALVAERQKWEEERSCQEAQSEPEGFYMRNATRLVAEMPPSLFRARLAAVQVETDPAKAWTVARELITSMQEILRAEEGCRLAEAEEAKERGTKKKITPKDV